MTYTFFPLMGTACNLGKLYFLCFLISQTRDGFPDMLRQNNKLLPSNFFSKPSL
ncbi:hypothetical protein M23134_00950 [Microscilla marina ATCC 23134]|uniref:Uncharacterized protein n=1 Tax=Microscilla marina ATCC 23134 TaxID=313606 RepID=A1ZZM7_MICM2|nr:hypothetical protein M23134_00950 [Microscilla marina ATCC 23134]